MRSGLALSVVVALTAGCGGGGGFPDARVKDDAPPPPGTFKLSWTLTDSADAPIPCDRVQGITVVATMRSTDIVGGMTQVFTCQAGMGESQAVAPGNYTIDFELDGGTGAGMTLATFPRMDNVKITSGGSVSLPPIVFKVDATGNLAAHLAAVKTGITHNCGAGADSAGITGTTITLTQVSGGACASGQTLTIGPSAMTGDPGGTYTVDCATPQAYGCIETDQSVSATAMPSGNYLIHVRGTAAGACWKNDDQLAIPAVGATKTTTLNLGFQATGC